GRLELDAAIIQVRQWFKASPVEPCVECVDLTQMEVAERARADLRMADGPHGEADRAVSKIVPPIHPDTARGERMVLNLFFEEKDDRWFRGDRHLRMLLRRLLLGKPWI